MILVGKFGLEGQKVRRIWDDSFEIDSSEIKHADMDRTGSG